MQLGQLLGREPHPGPATVPVCVVRGAGGRTRAPASRPAGACPPAPAAESGMESRRPPSPAG